MPEQHRPDPNSNYEHGVWKGSVTSTLESIDDKLSSLKDDFHQHEKSDARVFAAINTSLSDLKVSQARWGAGLLVTLTLLGWVLPPIVKKIIGAE